MNPLVSIILPTHNGAGRLTHSIESVMAQRFTDWELIIINDGSTDGTKEVVEGFLRDDRRIVYIENERNLGLQQTLNRGIASARGNYIARIDDDDVWNDVHKLAAQVDFFENHPDYVLVGTDATVVDEKGNTVSTNIMPHTDAEIRSRMLSKNCFLHSTIMMRKSILDKVGTYSEAQQTRHAEDYELWLRVGTTGKLANLVLVSTVLTAHRLSLTAQNRVLQARNILRASVKNRGNYPNAIAGYLTSAARLAFFSLLSLVPIPSSLWYRIQRTYRSI